ncbi:Hypp7354 [Branchiostoma lanceolatum]|uniref:Hypp7354 protein n=1 Tax=Branchiostoma lanceolatum TaxID=7740 RepID=A0A8J9YZY3_BRALA|nr:Hypp7354 [Branchiostoma lanceolatum]
MLRRASRLGLHPLALFGKDLELFLEAIQVAQMDENNLNHPEAAGNGEPDSWGWLTGFIIPTVVPPLLEQQILGEAENNTHARGLGVPAGLRKIFKYDNYCGPRPEDHGYLMWEYWRDWKSVVDKEGEKLSSERFAKD